MFSCALGCLCMVAAFVYDQKVWVFWREKQCFLRLIDRAGRCKTVLCPSCWLCSCTQNASGLWMWGIPQEPLKLKASVRSEPDFLLIWKCISPWELWDLVHSDGVVQTGSSVISFCWGQSGPGTRHSLCALALLEDFRKHPIFISWTENASCLQCGSWALQLSLKLFPRWFIFVKCKFCSSVQPGLPSVPWSRPPKCWVQKAHTALPCEHVFSWLHKDVS